jgi:hypothetical protein
LLKQPEQNKEPEMKAQVSSKSGTGPVKVSMRQAGMTLVSTAISFVIAGFVLTGAWMAVSDMKAQMHVEAVERQMDQYAQGAISELTNRLSWSWYGEQIQGGYRYTRWNFQLKDEMAENGTWQPWFQRDTRDYIQVHYQPTRGIMFGDRVPKWAEDNHRAMYVWTGRAPGRNEINMMDKRDRMTMESLIMDWSKSDYVSSSSPTYLKGRSALDVQLTLQYHYRANSLFGLYPKDYVRERTYQTSIYQRNWWSDINDVAKDYRASIGGQG